MEVRAVKRHEVQPHRVIEYATVDVDVNGRTLTEGDHIRVEGQGSKRWVFKGLALDVEHPWITVFGPVDSAGKRKDACWRSFTPASVKSKCRSNGGG